jgi:hypothetical protein
MALSPRVAGRLATLGTIASFALALIGALAMSDRVRLVDIISLFFGGVGAGAGLVVVVGQRRRQRRDPAALAASAPGRDPPHTPPTVPWREPRNTRE